MRPIPSDPFNRGSHGFDLNRKERMEHIDQRPVSSPTPIENPFLWSLRSLRLIRSIPNLFTADHADDTDAELLVSRKAAKAQRAAAAAQPPQV